MLSTQAPTLAPTILSNWGPSISTSLSKLFMGPMGTATRLHYDAGDAHAWLGQIQGRKLFVCFSPHDSKHLYTLETEVLPSLYTLAQVHDF